MEFDVIHAQMISLFGYVFVNLFLGFLQYIGVL